ncbi:HalOD1 output domain-containing protein [Natrarchaeobius chitinivorans]|uniref:Halobacterial output domain-containing protein n=1 Tax=Natrarchaeobius chitinivorans TaxID=1679083 RepID=A0A3N6MLS3_NATCH|nr:HalOD1 output domain-containing protein [Natrarchaeobius chitinivorans]RQG96981.1 hypothetical protein EA473_02550 [Natrarchaeobius chitinivorans]
MSLPDNTSSAGDVGSPSQAIIEAVAAQEGVDVTDIEPPDYAPLYTVVNPEALDELFRTATGSPETVRVVFEYAGYDIVVYGDGSVEVDRASPSTDSVSDPIDD